MGLNFYNKKLKLFFLNSNAKFNLYFFGKKTRGILSKNG